MTGAFAIGLLRHAGEPACVLVFVAAALDTAALAGLVLPAEALVVLAGFAAAQGGVDLLALTVATALGAWLGDQAGYLWGRGMGAQATKDMALELGFPASSLARVREDFEGGRLRFLLAARFLPGVRPLAVYLAGAQGLRHARFAAASLSAAAAWAGAFVLLGHVLGLAWLRFGREAGPMWPIAASALAFALLLAASLRRPAALALRAGLIVAGILLVGSVAMGTPASTSLAALNRALVRLLTDHGSQPLMEAAVLVAYPYTVVPLAAASMGIAAWLIDRGLWLWLARLVLAVPLGAWLSLGGRSAHVAGAALLYGFLGLLVLAQAKGRATRACVVLATVAMVGAVALARMCAKSEHVAQVLAGLAFGVAWLAFSFAATADGLREAVFARLARPSSQPVPPPGMQEPSHNPRLE